MKQMKYIAHEIKANNYLSEKNIKKRIDDNEKQCVQGDFRFYMFADLAIFGI